MIKAALKALLAWFAPTRVCEVTGAELLFALRPRTPEELRKQELIRKNFTPQI